MTALAIIGIISILLGLVLGVAFVTVALELWYLDHMYGLKWSNSDGDFMRNGKSLTEIVKGENATE